MTNFNKFTYFIEQRQDDIYESIEKGYFNLAKEDIIKFSGIIAYAWQCDIITDEQYTNYREWAHITRSTIKNVQKELVDEGYIESL